MGSDFWVVIDNLPNFADPEMLYHLYVVLEEYVQPHDDSPLRDFLGEVPIVVRFVPEDAELNFPEGAEGFAGLSDTAVWTCDPKELVQRQTVMCAIHSASECAPGEHLILLAVVAIESPGSEQGQKITIGAAAHELAHLLGAVDGPRCPASDDYNPMAQHPDPSDTYWFYGVTGFFTLTPGGIVWDALNGDCAESDYPDICLQFQRVFEPAC